MATVQRKKPSVAVMPRPRDRSSTEQPGNSFKYLYWRLSEKQFQQLCAALLRIKYDPVQCLPVGMADEGIDIISEASIIYQVKWSSKTQQDPSSWLKAAIDGERAKIARLVAEGRASRYVLMTSVAGTTTATRSGSVQRLNKELAAYSQEFGIPVECWWQADIDAEVDASPESIKWSYPEMLAGTEAMRYLIHGSQVSGDAAKMRDTLLQVMATQWRDDSRIKFSQVEMDRVHLVDFFVDVQISQQAAPRNVLDRFLTSQDRQVYETAAAVEYMLKTTVPLTYLLGVPGQGKSTLGQYLCQVHRAEILPGDMLGEKKPPHESVSDPKLPLRVDLKDYGTWLSGHDPFGDDELPKKPKLRRKDHRSLELFLAALCSAYSGGRLVTVEQIQSLLARYPTFLVLDGLDEVADPALRKVMVEQINITAMRMGSEGTVRRFQILVTSRPNASGLSEPDKDIFQTLRLEPLTQKLQRDFVNKWADAHQIHGAERRRLQRTFQSRTAIDHIAQLADNPMQLTILLFLISRKGEAVPVSRTPLYSDYMETLLDREVDRKQIEREELPRVAEVTSFLGWHMQSGVETDPRVGRMTRDNIETTLFIYFRRTEGPSNQVSHLFRAVTDRFWALTSKVEGTFEFAVQPVREYFAAKFLAEFAGQDLRDPLPKQEVLGRLIERPYWLNTARFYAGFANPNELASLRYGLEDILNEKRHPLQVRVAVWALVNDGIFANKPRVQRDVVRLLTDDLSLRLIAHPGEASTNFPHFSRKSGGDDMVALLLDDIQSDPLNPMALVRASILRRRLPLEPKEFSDWWVPQMRAAIGTPRETAWLRIGAAFGVPRVMPPDATKLSLKDPESCQAALSVGASPDLGTAQDRALLRAVLDGWCSDTSTSSSSLAGSLLRATRPQWYLQLLEQAEKAPPLRTEHLWIGAADRSLRSSAWNQLVDIDARYAQLKRAANARGKGQKGTTEPWQNPAREIARIHGPCWLAAEIAVIGAAAPSRVASGSFDPGGEPFGTNIDYGTFVLELRRYKCDQRWWEEAYGNYSDSLSRRTWVLALFATAGEDNVVTLMDYVDEVLDNATESEFAALAASSSRLGVSGVSCRLGSRTLRAAAGGCPRTALLATHFASSLSSLDPLKPLSDRDLVQLSAPDAAAWAVARAITARLLDRPSNTLLAALAVLGPQSKVEVPSSIVSRSSQLITPLLDQPANYPGSWVFAAEQWRSISNDEVIMEDVVVDQGWAPKVPRV
ncbi:NACHT domain-containing protein [Micromonospora sp. NBC_00617]|uniref:NACHT domain-containing protein n=1 Tax=Micromonospora sp. NBC_00617 TaxID=2903587 RepID=UPI0030DEB0D5